MLEFPSRAETAQRPGMSAGLVGLLGASGLNPALIDEWSSDWKLAFQAAAENGRVDPRIHPARLNYYEKAIKAMLAGETPYAALWPLLQTWALAIEVLPEHVAAWNSVSEQLGFTPGRFEEHVNGLDQYLDEVEILLDELATQHGLETSTSI